VDGDELTVLSVTEHTRLYSGDCYIVQYTFPGKGKDETLFYAWLGGKCVTVDVLAVIHRNGLICHYHIIYRKDLILSFSFSKILHS
jgi:hypothetical protein